MKQETLQDTIDHAVRIESRKELVKAIRAANKQIAALIYNHYFERLPLAEFSEILRRAEIPFESLDGIYCGATGRATTRVADDHILVLSWYKMPSGRFEVTAYIS